MMMETFLSSCSLAGYNWEPTSPGLLVVRVPVLCQVERPRAFAFPADSAL